MNLRNVTPSTPNAQARLNEAQALSESGRPSDAVAVLENLLAADPSDDQVRWAAAVLWFQLEDYGRAAQLFGELVEHHPDLQEAADYLAASRAQQAATAGRLRPLPARQRSRPRRRRLLRAGGQRMGPGAVVSADRPIRTRVPEEVQMNQSRTRKAAGRVGVALSVLLLVGLLPLASTASAHALWGSTITRVADGRPPTQVDGDCSSEYLNAPALARLMHPITGASTSISSGTVRFLGDRNNLYICAIRMPLRPGSVVSVGLDSRHDGGAAPRDDDWRVDVAQTGTVQTLRGDGTRWVPTPLAGVQAGIRHDGSTQQWTAEIKVPIPQAGSGARDAVTGFVIEHPVDGIRYAWPPGAPGSQPGAWADLYWNPMPTSAGSTWIDVARITQGLDHDVPAAVAYDRIAGKDTLVRSQVFTRGTPGTVTYAACRVYGPGGRSFLVPASGRPTPTINLYPVHYFNGSPTFDCWIPGNQLLTPGLYQFELILRLDGLGEQVMNVGMHTFQATGDLRLFLQPNVFSFAATSREWGNDLTANIAASVLNVNRMIPVRSGVGSWDWAGTRRPDGPGLRFLVGNTVLRCRPGESMNACGARIGTTIGDSMRSLNAQQRTQRPAGDRLDYGVSLQAATAFPGGGDCGFGDDVVAPMGTGVMGLGFDANPAGASASGLAHEVTHCLGEVRTSSPHYQAGGHSMNGAINLPRGESFVNTVSRQDVSTPRTLMFPSVGGHTNIHNEGFEWNDVRRPGLTAAPRPAMAAAAAEGARRMLRLSGYLDDGSRPVVLSSGRGEAGDEPEPQAASPGRFQLVFVDHTGKELGKQSFDATSPRAHGGKAWSSFWVTAPIPDGATKAVVREGAAVHASVPFTAEPPSVADVQVAPGGSAGELKATWKASDLDGPALTYGVYLVAHPGGPRQLLETGLSDTSFSFSTSLMPKSTDAQLIVEATDGINTTSAASPPFATPAGKSLPAIAAPLTGDDAVEGQDVTLTGVAWDPTLGVIADDRLEWRSDRDGMVGTGSPVTARLSPGHHQLSLVVKDSPGGSESASVALDVAADGDGDGLPAAWEQTWSCLSPTKSDATLDHDEDGLVPAGERARQLNPCAHDTDGDGFTDGDEVRLDTDALDKADVPEPDGLHISTAPVNLGTCPKAKAQTVDVHDDGSDRAWAATSDQPWLQVQGSGAGDGTISITADCSIAAQGLNTGQILVGGQGVTPRLIPVRLVKGTTRGDYDGDGSTEVAVYRPSNGYWFVHGGPTTQFGTNGDVALPLPDAIRRFFFTPL